MFVDDEPPNDEISRKSIINAEEIPPNSQIHRKTRWHIEQMYHGDENTERYQELNAILIPAKVNGLTPVALVDTGSKYNIISTRLASILDANEEACRLPGRVTFDTLDSDEKNGFLTFMSLQICFLEELVTSNFLVNASDNADLILGQEFLKKVKAVTDQNPKKIIPQTWTLFLRKGTALKLYASLGLKQYEMIRTRATGKETKGPESGWTPCVTQ